MTASKEQFLRGICPSIPEEGKQGGLERLDTGARYRYSFTALEESAVKRTVMPLAAPERIARSLEKLFTSRWLRSSA